MDKMFLNPKCIQNPPLQKEKRAPQDAFFFGHLAV